jgi:glycosyltransferase involved in cell wall biosynthesis
MEINYSLLLPVRNGQRYVENITKNMISVMKETDELLVIDDGSTDDTLKIVKNFVAGNPTIRVFSNSGIGLVRSLNFGVGIAKSEWIARVDVDDIYESSYLHNQKYIAEDDVGVIFTDYRIESPLQLFFLEIPNAIFHYPIILSLLSNRRTPHPSAVINKMNLLRAGGYSEQAHPAEDLELWFRLGRSFKLRGVDKQVLRYQRNEQSVTYQKRNQVREMHQLIVSSKQNRELLVEAYHEVFENLDYYFKLYAVRYNQSGRKFFLIADLLKANLFLHITPKHKMLQKLFPVCLRNPRACWYGLAMLFKYSCNRTYIPLAKFLRKIKFAHI